MQECPQVRRVLQILQLTDAFDFVASRDDVERGKPDPEIYLLVANELGVSPRSCLVIEDSPCSAKLTGPSSHVGNVWPEGLSG